MNLRGLYYCLGGLASTPPPSHRHPVSPRRGVSPRHRVSRLSYDEAMSDAAAPLDGLVGLEFTLALAGPYCTMLMPTYGANVFRVEEPEHGEIGRAWGPPFQGSDSAGEMIVRP